MQSYGEYTPIQMGRRDSHGNCLWTTYPHEDQDGILALKRACKTLAIDFEQESLSQTEKPSFFNHCRGLFYFLLFSKKHKTNWKHRKLKSNSGPTSLEICKFSFDETQIISESAKKNKVSLNSYLLWALGQAIDPLFENESVRRWLIPVDMRRRLSLDQAKIEMNRSSYIIIDTLLSDSAAKVHALVKLALSRFMHWGGWKIATWGEKVSPFLGRTLTLNLMKLFWKLNHSNQHTWAGIFSNLGAWKSSDLAGFFFCPPVISSQPIAFGALVWNGELRLAAQAHSSLELSAGDLQNIYSRLRNVLINECEV